MKNTYFACLGKCRVSGSFHFLFLLAAFIGMAAVSAQAQIKATFKTTESTCQANGTLSVSSVTGGLAPYSAALIAGPGVPAAAPYFEVDAITGVYTFSGLAAGTYTVSLIDDSIGGNEARFSVTVPGSYSISNYTPVPSLNTCANGTQTGKITVSSITAGRVPFRYRYRQTAPTSTAFTAFTAVTGTSFVIDNLRPGATYEVQVWDVCDNFQTRQVQIPAIANPTVGAATIRYLDCAGNAQATFTASGGTSPYTYSVTAGPNQVNTSNTTGVFSFTTGTYTVRVTDQCGGVTTRSVTIGTSPPFNLNVSGAASASCSSGTGMTGAITIAVSGGISPYQSVVVKGCSGQTITLQPDANGNYNQTLQNLTRPCVFTVVATDACGTVRTQTFDMVAPGGSTVMGSQNSVDCPVSGSNNLRLTFEATLGPPYSPTQPYTFTLLNSSGVAVAGYPTTTSNRTQMIALAPGVYTYRIADACGTLSALTSVTIGTYTPPTVSLISSNQCINAGQVNLTGTNSNPLNPTFKQYRIVSGPNRAGETNTSGVFSNLISGGAYTFEFSDGCKTVTTPITVPPYQQPSFEVGFGALCVPISVSSTATLQAFNLNPTNVVRPYFYQIIPTGTTGTPNSTSAQLDSVFTNLRAGFYNIQGFDACNNSFAFVGQVGALPPPGIQASRGPYCVGQLFRIRVAKPVFGATYTYFQNGQQLLSTTAINAQVPAQAGGYSVLVTAPGGCTAISDASFTVQLTGVLTLNGPLTACAGGSVDLTAPAVTTGSGSGTFSYFQDANGTVPLDATTGPANAITKAGTYYIKITATASCSNIAPISVSFAPAFTATLSSATSCAGQSVTLTATGGVSYNFGSGVASASTRVVAPTVTTTYSVTAINNIGCPASATGIITVSPLPTATLTNATICVGQTATLTAGVGVGFPGVLYNFGSGNSTANTLIVTPNTTTTYSVTVTSDKGCIRAVSSTVTVNPLPVATLSSATICKGQTTSLTASGGTLYNFGTGNQASTKLVVTPTSTTPYTVTVTTGAGCSATAQGAVTVNDLPVAGLSSATICAGETATLTASGGTLYNFGSGNHPGQVLVVVNPANTSTYTVLVTNANGCTAIGSGSVTVKPLPLATLSSTTICAGQSATLTASGGGEYDFGNGNQTVNTLVISPATTTAYSVIVTNAEGCTQVASAIVTVNQLPAATFSSATICRGQSASLTATGGMLYNFGSGNSATGTLIVTPANTTNYQVIVTDAKGCTASASATVTVNPLPEATLSGATICVGQSATLTASGGSIGGPFGYTLLNTNTVNSSGQFVVSPTTTTSYTVVVGNNLGCRAVANSVVTVNSVPVATLVSTSNTICEGQSATLTATGGSNGGPFSYEFSENINNITGILVVSPSVAATYSVVVTNSFGCTASASRTVGVNPVPVLNIVPANQVVCLGNSSTLTVTNCPVTGTIRWSTGANTASVTITPLVSTTYSVLCTTPQGCTVSAASEVIVSIPGSVSVTDNAPLCPGTTLNLSASGTGSLYRWSGPNGFTANTPIVSVSNVSTLNTGVYSVTISGGLCEGVGSTTVTLHPAVTASLSSASICDGESTTLIASGNKAGETFLYEFSENVNNTTGRLVVSPSQTKTYSVTITNAQGCVGVASGVVTLHPSATATLSSSTICIGQSTTITATGGTLYNFGSGNTTSNILIVNPTTTTPYRVVVTNGTGCTAAATATVTVNPLPVATLSSATICVGQSATLLANGGNTGAPFSYTFDNGTINTTGLLPVSPTATTSYSVRVSSNVGCISTAQNTLTVNRLPTALLSSMTICAGESATLSASGGKEYDFGTGATSNNIFVVEPTASTTYTVLVIDGETCRATATGRVTVNPLPVASLSSATICIGGSATLNASGGISGGPFTYTLLNTGAVNATGSFPLSPTATTTYTILVATADGCKAPASGIITVNALPMPTLSSATICAGQSATLTASVGVGFSGTLYNFGSGNSPDGVLIVSPSLTSSYSVIATNAQGCTAVATSRVVVNAVPIVTLSSLTICAGQSATLVASVSGTQAGLLYNYGSGNQPTGTIIENPAATTTYSVVVTNAQTCTALANGIVTVTPLPAVGVVTITCQGLSTYSVTFTATTGASVTSNLGIVSGNQVINIPSGQTVTLTATLNGCSFAIQTTENCQRFAASLGDQVFVDTDGDGIQNNGEPGLGGVIVTLISNGSVVATTTTNPDGTYSFTGLIPGIPYSVSFTTPAGYTATTFPNGITQPVILAQSENNTTLDAGFRALYDVAIAKTVLSNEPYYPGSGLITYQLTVTNNSTQPVYNVRVQDQLPAGISFVSGAGFASSGINSVSAVVAGPLAALGGSQNLTLTVSVASTYTASNVINNAAITRFTATTDAAGPAPTDTNPANNTASVTVPIAPLASLGNFVFSDTDRDGVQDTGELGINGITVVLYINGVASATTTTTDGGLYSFTGLTPGSSFSYSVGFSNPLNFSVSPANQGGSETLDSDLLATGQTAPISLTAGENNLTVDAGFYPLRFDLALTKSVVSAPSPLLPGSLIRYAIVLINEGEITATNTQIADTPPVGLVFNAANSPGFTSNGSSASAVVVSLSPGQSATLSIAYTLIASTSMALSNRAQITADSGDDLDSEPGNGSTNPDEDDTATATIQPVQFAALGNFVWEDTNGNGQQDSGEPGIEDVVVSLVQNGSVIASTTTGAGGIYSFTGLVPGVSYQVQFGTPTGYSATVSNVGADASDSDRDPITGLSHSVSMTGGETNNTLDAGFYRPATLGDQVFVDTDGDGIQNNGEPGLGGVIVTLISNGSVVATATTNPDGTYSFTGLIPGIPYSVSFTTPVGYTATTFPMGVSGSVTLASGESNNTLDAGFTARYDVSLAKTVLSNEPYYPGSGLVTYQLTITNNSTQPVYNVRVQDQLPAGISFVSGAGFASSGINSVSAVVAGPLAALGGSQNLTLTVSVASTYTANTVTNNAAITRFTATTDAAGPAPTDTNPNNNTASVTVPIAPLASLGNFVFSDTNRDGVQDTGELGINGITVVLYINGVASATTTTTGGGLYSFTGLTPGSSFSYSVGFSNPLNFSVSPANQGGNETLDSDLLASGLTAPISLTAGENNLTLDAGFYPLRFDLALTKSVVSAPTPLLQGSLIRYAIVLINEGEITATNTQVTDSPPTGLVFNAANSPGFTSNGISASALVVSLSPGQSATLSIAYTVTSSTSMALTNRAQITADSGDDLDSEPGNGLTNPDEDDTATATIQPVQFAALGNFVWEDVNGNGQQDSGEPGIEDVVVSLVQNGSVIATTTTGAGGIYSFTGLTPGVFYQVQFGTPTGYSATTANVGGDASDSDRDPITGLSQSVSMTGGETNNTLDAGFYRPATLGDQVFVDTDGDGIQNNGEPGLGGVIVTLISSGSVVATATTNPDGTYSFTGLIPGVPYSVSFTTPVGYTATTFPTGVSGSVTLASGETNNTLDAGFQFLLPKLDVEKRVSAATARVGEVVSYTITVTNTGFASATSVSVSDEFSGGLSLIPGSASASLGSFTATGNGGTWSIATLPVGTTATLTYSASIIAEGLSYNTATVPGDQARVCLSVPFRVCAGSDYAIEVSAPTGFTRYQWLYTAPGSTSAIIVADGPLNSYTATKAGEYKMVADDGLTGLCARPSCCPVYIEEVAVPAYTALVGNPTCIGTTPQANGQIRLTNLGADPTEYFYQITPGSSFTAAGAVPSPLAPVPANGVISTSLAAGTYTVRVWLLLDGQPTCSRDLVVVVPPADCACPEEICVPVIIKKTKSVVR